MAVVRNLIANSLNQGVSFLVNIFAVPIYFALLGVEQYGLIGFAVVVQTWVNLLETGMSGTLGREMTRFKSGHADERGLLSFLRSLDLLFLGAIILLPLLAIATSYSWSAHWLSGSSVRANVISQSIILVVALAAVRIAGNLYRGGLMGLERQVFASWLSILSSIGRLLVPLPFVAVTHDVRVLFIAWLLVSLVELVMLRVALGNAFTARLPLRHFSFSSLSQRTHIWGSIGFLAVAWTAISQTDKVVLSRVLPLGEYGRFTLVMILSNAILSIATPVSFAFQPGMTSAAARRDSDELAKLARSATRILVVLMVAPAFALAAVPKLAIIAWTGQPAAAETTSAYLGPYVVGSAIGSFSSIVYLIQYAYGDLKLHVRAYGLFALLLIPAEIVIANRLGALGAAWLWLAVNIVIFVGYYPLVFHRFLPGQAKHWYGLIIAAPAIASAGAAFTVGALMNAHPTGRIGAVFGTAATAFAACAAAAAVTLGVAFRERRRLGESTPVSDSV